jgi:hypothetical protein
MKIVSLIFATLFVFNLHAGERSPFTNIDFGLFMGWGDFIKVENPDYINSEKNHFLIEVNGKDYKDILKETKTLYGKKYKCRLAEHFVQTMKEVGIEVGDTVDLKVYVFDGGHEVKELKAVPVTEDNLAEIQFETNFCKN